VRVRAGRPPAKRPGAGEKNPAPLPGQPGQFRLNAMPNYTDAPKCATIPIRRDAKVKCAACGRSVARKMRGQRYCSKRCRQRSSREKLAACASKQPPRYPYSGDATTPHKSASNFNGLRRRKSGSSIYFDTPLHIVGGGSWIWPATPQLDAETRQNIVALEVGAAP
jgi:hypothetical protein